MLPGENNLLSQPMTTDQQEQYGKFTNIIKSVSLLTQGFLFLNGEGMGHREEGKEEEEGKSGEEGTAASFENTSTLSGA